MIETDNDGDVVELPSWPTCRNALAWSPEDLAVAAGEVVHMLTFRHASDSQPVSDQRRWHTFTFRVNQFETREWPIQDLATIKQYSIGEEMSDSTVSSLAWSPAGLGIYRRSVLAVLTSNLILSFWETDGSSGVWRRTCIVNTSLPHDPNSADPDSARLTHRVRCFAWLPSIPAFHQSEWSPYLLVLVDDSRSLCVYQVQKTKRNELGNWTFILLARHSLAVRQFAQTRFTSKAGLRAFLVESSPVSGLETSQWYREDAATHGTSPPASLKMKVSFGQIGEAIGLSIRVQNASSRASADTQIVEHDLRVTVTEANLPDQSSMNQPPMSSLFDSAIRKPQSTFSDKFNLGHRVLVRYWGTALSPDRKKAAACVSFHPSDMIESCLPSKQHTSVVFRNLGEPVTKRRINDNVATHDEILHFLASTPTSLISTDFDKLILSQAALLIKLQFNQSDDLNSWAESLVPYLSGRSGSIPPEKTVASLQDLKTNAQARGFHAECCEVCEAQVPFSSATSATCNKGHYFTRCNLSFVAIQEPGISMHCAQCGKQFLDPGKYEAINGQSLSQALFNRFDVCPYCQGKFRG